MYNHCCTGKAVRITYCEFASVALGVQHAVRVIFGLSGSTIFFSMLAHKRDDFFGEELLKLKCVFYFLYNFYLKPFSFEEEFSDIIIAHMFSRKIPAFLLDFNQT